MVKSAQLELDVKMKEDSCLSLAATGGIDHGSVMIERSVEVGLLNGEGARPKFRAAFARRRILLCGSPVEKSQLNGGHTLRSFFATISSFRGGCRVERGERSYMTATGLVGMERQSPLKTDVGVPHLASRQILWSTKLIVSLVEEWINRGLG